MPSSTRKAPPAKAASSPLPAWRWLIYAAVGAGVFVLVYWGSGGPLTTNLPAITSHPASRDAGFFGLLFGGLSLALAKLMVDPVFVGLAQRRSKAALARGLAEDVLKTGAGIAAGIAVDAVLGGGGSSASRDSASSGGPGGGGRSGGGGASGRY